MLPTATIKESIGINPNGPVQSYFTEACYRRMDKYVPMRNGDLRNDVTLTKNSITYEVPYATYQYFGQREDGTHKVQNYTTPGTGPYWDKQMLSAERADLIKEVQKFAEGRF